MEVILQKNKLNFNWKAKNLSKITSNIKKNIYCIIPFRIIVMKILL